ncbi:L,D-transpeptidase [Niallia taxi]|uniref:L,D-transpeptidase n=1 Tax=Niallia taxi TaxID=2499688 RepID=UPI0021A70EFA|nr:L,D-transpeptidase [Niallia taxi]MCT2346241.1 L,D-transpeptidase [Niallia taxi]MDE5052088.1 L,D-transpeptidase [Niallia taxi]MED3961942.1 L,D-transpeptidase [Niallia taxi]WOD64410.1 L,D-transpeptidase [Niallia taxi]
MLKFLAFMLLGLSPLWPLGDNPLPGDPFVIINKSTNELTLIDDNRVQTVISVATGKRDELTPEGLFTVTVKAENPYYRKKNIMGGDSKNPLGTRWIGFDAEGTDGRTYGIHGTNNPASIGHYVSEGCVRMQNEVIESIFQTVPLGTKVLITDSKQGSEALAIEYGAINHE